MLRYLLDTNLCIQVIRDRPPNLRAQFSRYADELSTSTIVLAELLHGAEKSLRPDQNRRRVEAFAARLEVLAFDADAAAHAADIKASLERSGQVIGPYDLLIAGHGRSRSLIVVTNNRREFDRVEGLRVESWT